MSDKDTELLPCPFCGAEPFMWKHTLGVKISCRNDCVTMPTRFDMSFTSIEEAAKAWNKRV